MNLKIFIISFIIFKNLFLENTVGTSEPILDDGNDTNEPVKKTPKKTNIPLTCNQEIPKSLGMEGLDTPSGITLEMCP